MKKLFVLGVIFLLVTAVFVVAVSGQPLRDLGILGERARERFNEMVKEDLEILQKNGFYQAAKYFRTIPEELTYWLQDFVGDYRVRVKLLALSYRNIGNLAPPMVAESLESFRTSLKLGDTPLPQIIIQEGDRGVEYLYVLPLRVKASCLPCHGPHSPYASSIEELYPEDQALGLALGSLRGALVIEIAPEALNRFASRPSKNP